MSVPRVGAIDIGSNTARALVAELTEGRSRLETLYSEQKITRLAADLNRTGRLSQESIERVLKATRDLVAAMRPFEPGSIDIVATAAARRASNGADLARRILDATGIEPRIIDSEREARLALKGALFAIEEKNLLMFDIGGGSLEYVRAVGGAFDRMVGTDLGVIGLTERYIRKAPTDWGEYRAALDFIEPIAHDAIDRLALDGSERALGVAGTVTSIAAIDLKLDRYDSDQINGHIVTAENFFAIKERICRMSLSERAAEPSLRGGREDLIVAGMAIVEVTLKRIGAADIIVSDYGAREGVALEALGL